MFWVENLLKHATELSADIAHVTKGGLSLMLLVRRIKFVQ